MTAPALDLDLVTRIKEIQGWVKRETVVKNVDIDIDETNQGLRAVILTGEFERNELIRQMGVLNITLRIIDGKDRSDNTTRIMTNITNNLQKEREHDLTFLNSVRTTESDLGGNTEFGWDIPIQIHSKYGDD